MSFIDIVADEDNLYKAAVKARKGCDWKKSVQDFDADLLYNIRILHNELVNHTYKPTRYYEFTLNERGKTRHIKACHIRDRVIQKSLCDNILNPILEKYLVYDNGASIKGKGIDFSRRRIVAHLEKYYKEHGTNEGYILQIDFKKFFDSISHEKLIKAIEEKLDDDSVNWLIEVLIHSFGSDRGLGIGSQISQICGLFYPTRIDTYCKNVLGLKYYARYMDDVYIIHSDKKLLQTILNEIEQIANDLELVINKKKTQIYKINKIFIFLKIKYKLREDGYVVKKLYKDSIIRERRRLKKYTRSDLPPEVVYNAYQSWRGSVFKYDSKMSIFDLDRLFNSLNFKNNRIIYLNRIDKYIVHNYTIERNYKWKT